MQIKVRHSINGKIFWALWLFPSLFITSQLFLLGIQNFEVKSYFIIFPMLLLIFLLSYLLLLLFRTNAPILIEGDNLTIAETFSFQKRSFLVTQILNVSVEKGFTGARVRLQDENGIFYTIGCLNPEDVLALKELASLNVL